VRNIEIRSEMAKSRFKQYEIAAQIGIRETSFSRMLRDELPPEQVSRIRKAITELAKGVQNGDCK